LPINQRAVCRAVQLYVMSGWTELNGTRVERTGDFRMDLAQRGGGAGCRLGVEWKLRDTGGLKPAGDAADRGGARYFASPSPRVKQA
jgi:hypothetical protein